MKHTLWRDVDRQSILDRIGRLTPKSTAQWGSMRAPEMLAHLTQSMRMATGELEVAGRKVLLRFPPIKQIAIHYMPFPKGLPTAPELLSRRPAVWGAEVAALRDAVDAFARRSRTVEWPEHPVFGALTPEQWGVLQYRHLDHHLRQFGA